MGSVEGRDDGREPGLMRENLPAFAALGGVLVNFAILLIHCRRDRRELKKLRERPEVRR